MNEPNRRSPFQAIRSIDYTVIFVRDMKAMRRFYEEVIGLPLIATWSESDKLFGKLRTYCHCFFGLADGGALAFFQFADKNDERKFSPPIPETPFHHIALKVSKATQRSIARRIKAAGFKNPDTFVLEHGYCRSSDNLEAQIAAAGAPLCYYGAHGFISRGWELCDARFSYAAS